MILKFIVSSRGWELVLRRLVDGLMQFQASKANCEQEPSKVTNLHEIGEGGTREKGDM